MAEQLPEYWLRGPLPGLPALLQPVAHALLQAREEVNTLMKGFPAEWLWEKPAGAASAGFHLQHLAGVIDRLFTYAQGKPLSDVQRASLQQEGDPSCRQSVDQLVTAFGEKVDWAVAQLRETDEKILTDRRGVGRAQLPSTVMGLLFHAAEHTMRHLGQLIVTVRVVEGSVNDHSIEFK